MEALFGPNLAPCQKRPKFLGPILAGPKMVIFGFGQNGPFLSPNLGAFFRQEGRFALFGGAKIGFFLGLFGSNLDSCRKKASKFGPKKGPNLGWFGGGLRGGGGRSRFRAVPDSSGSGV